MKKDNVIVTRKKVTWKNTLNEFFECGNQVVTKPLFIILQKAICKCSNGSQ